MDINYWSDRVAQCITQFELNQLRSSMSNIPRTLSQGNYLRKEIEDQSIRIANGQYLERELGGAELCDQELSIWSNSTPDAPHSRMFLDWSPSEHDFCAQYEDKDYSSFYTDWEKSNKYRENGVRTLLEVCKAYRTRKPTIITKRFKQLSSITAKGHWSKQTASREDKDVSLAQFLKLFSERLGALRKWEAISAFDWWRLTKTVTKIYKYLGYDVRAPMNSTPPSIEQKQDAMNFSLHLEDLDIYSNPEEDISWEEALNG